MLEKCVLTILELNWNQRLGHWRTKLNICHHMLTSSTQLQNRSFHVVERTRTSSKCQKMKNARAKRAKILFFIVKYANLWGFCCRRRRGCLSSLVAPRHRQAGRQDSITPLLWNWVNISQDDWMFSWKDLRREKLSSSGLKTTLHKAPMGIEPMTSCLLDRRSNQLSYSAKLLSSE